MMRAVLIAILTFLCVAAVLRQAIAEVPTTGQVVTKAQFLAPEPTLASTSVPSLIAEPDAGCQGCSAAPTGCDSGCDNCCAGNTCGGCCQTRGCGPCGILSTCNMYQRHPYFPPLHGYYHFRPYHHSHVRRQQMLVQTWGGNPANPYANEIFEAVYQQYKAETEVSSAPSGQ